MNKQELIEYAEQQVADYESKARLFPEAREYAVREYAEGAISGTALLISEIKKLDEPQKVIAHLAEKWHEDIGPVLWWDFPVEEPPYCGTPLDDDFPKYKTHFTELHIPDEVEEEPKWVVKVGNLYFCGWEDTTAQFVMNTVLGEDESIIKYKNEGTASSVAKNLGGTAEKA